MTPHYDPWLVTISVVIAIMASFVALGFASRLSLQLYGRWIWWLGGSIAMGVGIWSMHFVGMLAFHLPVEVRFDVGLVLLSVLVAIAASALALDVASRPRLPSIVLVVSSLSMGAAISGMHYIGMASMRLPATIAWRAEWVTASIAIAVTASFAALVLAFRLRGREGIFTVPKLGAAVAMGIAIVGMHYTGMMAARFTPGAVQPEGVSFAMHAGGVTISVVFGALVILSVALGGAAFDERARLLAAEQRARREAEAANRLKDEFLATLSHELRTPLNVIVGRAQMLPIAMHDAEKVRDIAESIARNGHALSHLVEDLLDVSRMTFGGVRLEQAPVDLSVLVENVASAIQPMAEAKSIRVRLTTVPRIPRVSADPHRLQQVIWNLLSNAVKFTDEGGEIQVVVRSESRQAVLTVNDSGRGIDAAFLPHVFDMFRQEEPSTSRTTGGLGIGLSIAHRIVDLHGGSLTAQSDGPGRGATFTMRLPLPPAEAAAFAVSPLGTRTIADAR